MQISTDQRSLCNIQSKMSRPNKRLDDGTETKGKGDRRGTDDTDLRLCKQGDKDLK